MKRYDYAIHGMRRHVLRVRMRYCAFARIVLFAQQIARWVLMPHESYLTDVVTKNTDRSVEQTVARFVEIISTRALKLFALVDQRQEATLVGLNLRESVLLFFGDPRVGTEVMDASPLAGLDFPLKVLVWSDGESTRVSYEPPELLARRHRLQGDLVAELEHINALTDALIGPL